MQLDEPRKILIVDDEPAQRTGLSRCCRAWGFDPDVAATAEEALALTDSTEYMYILTDLNMPGIGGQNLLERLLHSCPQTPCIIISGDASCGDESRMLPNVIHRLKKPVAPDVLHRMLCDPALSQPPALGVAEPTRQSPAAVRVLLVEDSSTDAMILDLAIQSTGFCASTKTASTIREARQLLRTEEFDIVFTDLRLPDSDGIRSVRELLWVAASVPLVVVSANDDDTLAEQAIQAGAQDHLVKGQYARAALGRIMRHSVERKKTEKRLLRLAMRDQLTGLVNRVFFRERVASALAAARRSGEPFAVMYVDLDGFKGVNDSHGHDAGDALIQQAAMRLQHSVREEDTIARLGGDEFAILLHDAASPRDVLRIAERCRQQLAKPFDLDPQEARISGSLGLAFYPEAGNSVDAMLCAADAAMYRAKREGRNGVCVFSPLIHEQSLERYRLEQCLKTASDRNEFRLVYQPQVAADGSIAGAEALLRWTTNAAAVPPAVFIPILEESGQILEVGQWVLDEA
ncbi:MAG TPA: diguanylate cyclase, partial [Polyangiaceae bacterium]|nr:diguanylate cyclase [Polyangiaceae bacterium]